MTPCARENKESIKICRANFRVFLRRNFWSCWWIFGWQLFKIWFIILFKCSRLETAPWQLCNYLVSLSLSLWCCIQWRTHRLQHLLGCVFTPPAYSVYSYKYSAVLHIYPSYTLYVCIEFSSSHWVHLFIGIFINVYGLIKFPW